MKIKTAKVTTFKKMIGLLTALMAVSTFIMPVAAEEIDPYKHVWLEMTNGARFADLSSGGVNQSYYFKFDGTGTNALHISNSSGLPYGQVTTDAPTSGVFYITDTGGRGYHDDVILMVAVNGTIPEDFNLHIESSGYTWTPTVDGAIPAEGVPQFQVNIVNGDFGPEEFTAYSQIWKPCSSENYQIYNTQNVSDTDNKFTLMFIDLKAGVLGLNAISQYEDPLIYNGAVKVNYTFSNLETLPAAFNAYGWCNQSNQDRGVSWTNKLDGTSSGTSGWDLNI